MNDDEIPKYLDFLKGTDWPAGMALPQPDPDPDGLFRHQIVMMPDSDNARWHAVWAKSARNDHEEFYGTKAEVIAWARPRCGKVLIWSDELRDIRPLAEHEEGPAE